MRRLVALALPPGPAYVEAIERVWANGDAFAPIDPRLPAAQAKTVLAALGAGAVIEADGEQRALSGGSPVEQDDALVIATSGTSGTPKGVVHTIASIQASAFATSAALGIDAERDVWLACLPLAHIGGLSVVLRSIITGTRVEVHDGFEAASVVDAAERGATRVSLVTRALNQVDAGLFHTVLIGGAAPPAELPTNVVPTYGMTETGSGVLYRIGGKQHRLEGLELRIDNDEIHLRGPMLFRGYRSLGQGNESTSPFDADGWFPTGDLGHLDRSGELVVQGRSGDVIVTGAEKVWPGPIERFLTSFDDTAEVALIGIPDPEWGHRVVAALVPHPDRKPPSLDELRNRVKQRFAPWAAPKQLSIRSELPKTSLGKVKRTDLTRSLSS